LNIEQNRVDGKEYDEDFRAARHIMSPARNSAFGPLRGSYSGRLSRSLRSPASHVEEEPHLNSGNGNGLEHVEELDVWHGEVALKGLVA
jgi:hypothetical protein